MKALGILCYIFGIIDFIGPFVGYELTGVRWSPIVAGVVGSIFIGAGSKQKK